MNHKKTRTKTAILLIFFVGLIVYFSSLFNGFFISDDEDQILNHPLVHSAVNIPKFFGGSTYYTKEAGVSYGLFYRPLMLSTYSVIYSLFGPDPLFFHLTQILLHIGVSLLVYLLLKKLISSNLALLMSLVFLVHPVNSETVLHAANMQEVLFMIFGLLTLNIMVYSKNHSISNFQFPIFIAMLLTLFAKETGILFVLLTIVYVFTFKLKNTRSVFLSCLLSLAIYIPLRIWAVGLSHTKTSIAQITHAPLLTRLINIPKIFITYLTNFFYPQTQIVSHFWMVKDIDLNSFYIPLIIILGFILLIFLAGIHVYIKKNNLFKTFLFFVLWFFLGISLHLQIIPLEMTYADHWFYFPVVGLLGIIGVIIQSFNISKQKLIIAFVLVSCLLTLKTVVRSFDWRDSKTLLVSDLKKAPDNYYLLNNLASIYIREKDYTQAKPLVEKSVSLYPYFGNLSNMGTLLMHEENLNQAETFFLKALEVGANYQAHQNYANFLIYKMRDYEKARNFSKESLNRYPKAGLMWMVLAQAEYALGDYNQALASSQKAYDILPFDLSFEVMSAIAEKREIEIEKYIEM